MHPLLSILALPLLSTADLPEPDRFERWEPEIAAIEKRLKAHPPKEGSVFFVGSSSIRLWNVAKSFPGLAAENVGFGGSEIVDSTHFVARIVIPHKPKTIVFYAGDNDIANGRTPEQVAADFKAFCEAVHKDLPRCRVLFIAVKPSPHRWKRFDDQKRANALVKDACQADARLGFVDIVPKMLGPDGMPIRKLYVIDGLHLSQAGYEIWTAEVLRALEK
jgi:lysophospholipase L1-like esterase